MVKNRRASNKSYFLPQYHLYDSDNKKLVALMAATAAIAIVSASATTPFTVAKAQIAIRENGVGLVDQSNVEQTNVQVQNQEACANVGLHLFQEVAC
jgi:hypothetical protein